MKCKYEMMSVELRSKVANDRLGLFHFLRCRNYVSNDDMYKLRRLDKGPIWQSATILTVHVLQDGKAIYETDEDIDETGGTPWNQLRCEYLLATLPREYIDVLIKEIEAISTEFKLSVLMDGQHVSISNLSAKVNAMADELTSTYGEPGANEVRIAIEEMYRRP